MTVSHWSQSIYLLTDSQLARGNAATGRRESRGSERVDGWMESERFVDKEKCGGGGEGGGQVRRDAKTE